MMIETANQMDRIAPAAREGVSELVDLLQELAGGNLEAVTVYGSALDANFDPEEQVVQTVMVLRDVDLSLLRRLAEHGASLGKRGLRAPLVMTKPYIAKSCDTFPLELIEIQVKRATVFGEDPFDVLTFKDDDVRHQCEREIKSTLIGLRQALLAAAGRDDALDAIEVDAGLALLRTMRGMAWLRGEKNAQSPAQIVEVAEGIVGGRLDGIRAAIDGNHAHGWEEFQKLYRDVARLGEVIDA